MTRVSGLMPAAKVAHYSPSSHIQTVLPTTDYEDELKTPFEKVLFNLHHDPKWVKEVSLGKRVGFYRFRGDLGQGNFSTVKLAHHQLTKDKVAVKVIEKAKLDQKTQRMLSREIANMDNVAHPSIIRLFEVVETLSRIHLVLEFAPGGELFNRVSTEGRLMETEASYIFSQVIAAVVYLHSFSIIHRDIKAENVFMASSRRVKLGDFGFSTKVSRLKEQLSTFCGSPPYAAPELYKDESYEGPAVDIWALGVLLFFLLTGDMPFKAATVASLKRQILGGSFLIPSYVSDDARDLINKLMAQDPKERMDPFRMSSHTWFIGREGPDIKALPDYVTFPRSVSAPEEDLTEEEKDATDLLQKWGINKKSLAQSSDMGARSSIVATYRILLHRLLQKKEHGLDDSYLVLPNKLDDSYSGFTTPETRSPGGSRNFSPKKNKFKLRNGFNRSQSVKSKTCVII